jgi:hypothetical protein
MMNDGLHDITEKVSYDETHNKIIVVRAQDVSQYLRQNKAERDATPEFGKYKGFLPKAMSIPVNVIDMMYRGQCCTDGKRYNLLSPDPEERRRALMHVQTEHKALMTVTGKPFSKKRASWR